LATNVQIKCINKSDRTNPHERILCIGGSPGATTTHWKRSQQQAIEDIESGAYAYWVGISGAASVWVVVAVSKFGNKYIKTTADGEQPNNLLALPECPL
jgi:uncharacterized protein DUF3892